MKSQIEQFVEEFQRVWTADGADQHGELWHDDIELHQPVLGSLRGRAACQDAFERLFVLVPDLTVSVTSWSGTAESLWISFDFFATVGGRLLTWPAVDRFRLDAEARILRRDSYFDPTPVLMAVLARPRAWPSAARARLLPRRVKAPPWPTQGTLS